VELFTSWQRTGRSPWGRVNQYKSLLPLVQLSVLSAWLIICSTDIFVCFWNYYFSLIINWICFDNTRVLIILNPHCLIDLISRNKFSWSNYCFLYHLLIRTVLLWLINSLLWKQFTWLFMSCSETHFNSINFFRFCIWYYIDWVVLD